MIFLYASAALMVATAIIHSIAGERRIIGPLLYHGGSASLSGQSRRVLRSAWHLTSAFMVSNAAVLVWPGTPKALILAIAGFWLAIGLFSLIASRGKHVGWPSLLSAGMTGLIGGWA